MASMRTVLGFGVTLATLAFALSACSSGSTSTNGSSPDGGSSEQTDGHDNGGSSGADGNDSECGAIYSSACQ